MPKIRTTEELIAAARVAHTKDVVRALKAVTVEHLDGTDVATGKAVKAHSKAAVEAIKALG